ncbi:diguanylate cyclase [Ancylobacter sonchi]|uniref:sensor domain-containing diguanylate cyclase n=1 Tax=Ancylobacter sonchi TaxID=1937790 RepID=UPI001BD1F099|nr:sensor domain-containing diguanylate cyclase [Ancylobacter sonchi]MBS7537254.1 diguanylate cyclase [Ancylobacter sonchi]
MGERQIGAFDPGSAPTGGSAYEHAPVGLCTLDGHRRILSCNRRFRELIGATDADLAGGPLADWLPGAGTLFDRLAAGTSGEADLAVGRPGEPRVLRLSATRLEAGLSLALSDVTAALDEQETLRQAVERSSFALESAGQWVWDYDIVENRVWRSQQWKRALGYAPDELADQDEPWRIVHPSDRKIAQAAMAPILAGTRRDFEATYRLRHKDGGWRFILSRGKVIAHTPDGRPARMLATSVDITPQKEVERELEATIRQRRQLEHDLISANRRLQLLAEIDSLTELPNRRKFDKCLEREFRRTRRERPSLVLSMLDVDYFKSFNDLYGHQAGDDCLRAVAEALQQVGRPTRDIVTRYGGEEFAAILVDIDLDEAIAVARRMAEAVERLAIPHSGSPFGRVTICIGLTLFRFGQQRRLRTPDQLVQAADRALYAAKEAGRDRIAVATRLEEGRVETRIVGRDTEAAPAD